MVFLYFYHAPPLWLAGFVIDDFGNEIRLATLRAPSAFIRAIDFAESDAEI